MSESDLSLYRQQNSKPRTKFGTNNAEEKLKSSAAGAATDLVAEKR